METRPDRDDQDEMNFEGMTADEIIGRATAATAALQENFETIKACLKKIRQMRRAA